MCLPLFLSDKLSYKPAAPAGFYSADLDILASFGIWEYGCWRHEMIPYMMRYLTYEEVAIFEKIKRAVNNFSDDIDLGVNEKGEKVILSCHILVRAVAKVFHIRYQDGYFNPNFQHSWIITAAGNIIDVYPVAILGGPFLVEGSVSSPAWHLYKPKGPRSISQGRFSSAWFRRAVYIVARELLKVT